MSTTTFYVNGECYSFDSPLCLGGVLSVEQNLNEYIKEYMQKNGIRGFPHNITVLDPVNKRRATLEDLKVIDRLVIEDMA